MAGSPQERITWRELSWEELLVDAERIGPDARFAELSDDEVVDRLSVGAAQLDAALCRWLELLAELVVRGVWATQGGRTPGSWLSWKLGIAPSTAREHVRVALRLRDFPATRDRFAAGTLSYSKARAITRCGVPAAEEMLLRWADDATAEQLESVARGFRTAERARRDAAEAEEGDGPSCSVRTRSLGGGRRSLTITGPEEEIVAIEDGLRRLAEQLVADRTGESTAEARRGAAAEEPDEVTGEAAGEDAIPDGPLREADDGRRVTAADQVDALATTLAAAAAAETPPDTSGLDRHTLVLHVSARDVASEREAGDGSASAEAPDVGGAADRSASAEALDLVRVTERHRRIRGMDRRALQRLACEAGIVLVIEGEDGAPLDVGRRQRTPTTALRRALQRRDGGCTFPGCCATRHLHAHHVQHWANGGPTDLGNLVLVCGFHHRFVHAQGWHIEVRSDGRHRYRPAGNADAVPRTDVRGSASAEPVAGSAPRTASAEALRPITYDGSGYDLDTAVAVLQRYHEHDALAA